jgi:hypothetical protein
MNGPYEHIHMSTNDHLAEMIEFLIPQLKMPEERAAISEAAARLRTKHKEPFNHEAFE